MTLKETSQDILSSQFLSQFERNLNDISLSNFLSLLDRLNVRFSEFKLHSSELQLNSQQHFLSQYGKECRSKNIISLNELIDIESVIYQKDKNIRHQHNKIMMNVINYFLINNYLELIEAIKKTETILDKTTFFYHKNRLNYLKGMFQIKTGNSKEGIEICKEAIHLMSHFGAADIANILQTELDDLLKESA